MNAKPISMPGTKRKTAEALRRNVAYLVQEFGVERIGFLTLTVGDTIAGRFEGISDRVEAERRFHRAMQHIAKRYQSGVTVTERHESKDLHWHLVVVVGADIRTGCDFAAFERRDYRSAPERLRLEWLWWRTNAHRWGLGRHELLPCKVNGDAIGQYVGKYIGKGWNVRLADDKGGRCVRYFGHWSKAPPYVDKEGKEHPKKPPFGSHFCACSARAGAWRENMKQIAARAALTQENISRHNGRAWAWRITAKMRIVKFVIPDDIHPLFQEGINKHNEEAGERLPIENTAAQMWKGKLFPLAMEATQ